MPKNKPDARAIVHNVYVGQDPQSVIRNLQTLDRRFKPDLFLLQESARLTGYDLPGFRTIEVRATDRDHRDDGNCRMLVRDGVGVPTRHEVRVRGPQWRGPKHGLVHPPRVFVGGTLNLDADPGRRDLIALCIHRMPGGPTSRLPGGVANWKAEHEAIVAFADDHPDLPLLLGADWNVRVTNHHPLGLGGLARRIRAAIRVKGIDGVLARGFKAVKVKRLFRRYGSDHHRPIVVDLWFR